MEPTSKLSNLAAPLTPAFTSDELSLIIGTCLPEAVAVFETVETTILGGNQRLAEILEISLSPSSKSSFRFEEFVHPEDRELFRSWIAEDLSDNDLSFQIKLVTAKKKEVNVEFYLSSFRWKRQEFLLAYLRPSTEGEELTLELKGKIAEQKRKTLEAVKSSLLIYQFTEKIKKTPLLTTNLLSTENEAQLFERAARILTGEGLNYKDVTFFLVEDQALEICHSTKPVSKLRLPFDVDNEYTRFVREGHEGLKNLENEILVPLACRGSMLGLIAVTMHPRERIFFDELNLVSEWQKDALLTIGDMIALLLDNLRLYREVRRQSITDTLTGVHNRHYFINRLSNEINRCSRTGRSISLIFIDVDEFKLINDRFGHLQGDEVLKQLSTIFKHNIREYDSVCRYGGDEFVILLPEARGEQAKSIALKLLEKVRSCEFQAIEKPHQNIDVSISIGVTEMHQSVDEDVFLKSADSALYKAKELGRNRMVFNQT